MYRDGALRRVAEEWWTAASVARVQYDGAGVTREVSEEFAALLGMPAGAMVGRPFTDYVFADARDDAQRHLAILMASGFLEGVIRLRGADDRAVVVEHRTRLLPDGIESIVRPIGLLDVPGAAWESGASAPG